MKVLKILTNGRVISAVISAVGAIISAVCAGCKLHCGELSFKDFEAEFFSSFNIVTNSIQEIKNNEQN